MTEYPAWSNDTNGIEITNPDQYRSCRQEILNTWQKDTPIKMPDNRQVLDNLEAYVRDKLSISRSLHDRLGLTENSLPGAQTVNVAMVQSDQLNIKIPDYSPSNIGIGQENENDYQDNREDYLYQVDSTMDLHTLTDPSTDDGDAAKDREKYMCTSRHKQKRVDKAETSTNIKETTRKGKIKSRDIRKYG